MSLVYVGFVPHPPIMIPEVGRGEEKGCQQTADAFIKLVENVIKMDVNTVLIVSPHAPLSREGLIYLEGEQLSGNFSRFGASHVSLCFETDQNILIAIKEKLTGSVPVTAELDHGSLIPLYFLQKAGWTGKIVVVAMPLDKPERFGKIIGEILNDSEKRCALIASGDLSHRLKEDGPYGFHPSGPKLDNLLVKGLKKDTTLIRAIPESLIEEAGQCGYNSLLFALGAREGAIKVLSYEGPFGVGYLVAEIYRSSPVAGYARECLEYYLTSKAFDKQTVPGDPLLKEKRGCFVTLYKDGTLRGCIGTIQPVRENLASEIKHNAIAAGTQDPRFWPVQEDELPLITVSVDVLGETEKIPGPEELDPKRYGVVVRRGGRVGLLLPHLEGIDTAEEQVRIAKQKAGIDPKEDVEFWRFEVDRYYE
ncbi:AmmeMemoRadiSam system protein A [Dehalobacter sp. DCM]|uniref:AmmeMemoRadiSam system protein A n=1 Tax=Dehalobacter sp. DCM TaxID=2907827 RepID=UPI00308212DF|nr:AmmeMemoRadiSam system protein A [Dehalobacter sp. DCM]